MRFTKMASAGYFGRALGEFTAPFPKVWRRHAAASARLRPGKKVRIGLSFLDAARVDLVQLTGLFDARMIGAWGAMHFGADKIFETKRRSPGLLAHHVCFAQGGGIDRHRYDDGETQKGPKRSCAQDKPNERCWRKNSHDDWKLANEMAPEALR